MLLRTTPSVHSLESEKRLLQSLDGSTVGWRRLTFVLNIGCILCALGFLGVAFWVVDGKWNRMGEPIALASVVIGVAVLGLLGTNQASYLIVRGRCNYLLCTYHGALLLSFFALLVTSVSLVSLLQGVDQAAALSPGTAPSASAAATPPASHGMGALLERRIENWVDSHPAAWFSLQNSLHCCGYINTHDKRATGAACAAPTAPVTPPPPPPLPCKQALLDVLRSRMRLIALATVLLAVCQLLMIFATCCVLCNRPRRKDLSLASQAYDVDA